MELNKQLRLLDKLYQIRVKISSIHTDSCTKEKSL